MEEKSPLHREQKTILISLTIGKGLAVTIVALAVILAYIYAT